MAFTYSDSSCRKCNDVTQTQRCEHGEIPAIRAYPLALRLLEVEAQWTTARLAAYRAARRKDESV